MRGQLDEVPELTSSQIETMLLNDVLAGYDQMTAGGMSPADALAFLRCAHRQQVYAAIDEIIDMACALLEAGSR